MQKLRFGIIATGNIAHKFARTAPLVDEIELCAVASRTLDKAQQFADKYGIEKAYASYEQLYNDPDIDAVYISTPHNFHMQNCIDAANAKKHILCEKPLGLDRQQDQKMFEAAAANNVFIMEAMWTRFLPCTEKAREWVQNGLIGNVEFISVNFGVQRDFDPNDRLFAPHLAGGALYDLGVYTTEFIQDFTRGKKITQVSGVYQNYDIGTDKMTSAVFKFDDGAQATMMCSLATQADMATNVYGSKGHIHFDNFQIPKRVELYVDNELKDSCESEFTSGFEYEIRHMAKCISQGELTSPIISPEDTMTCADVFTSILK